jgi:hypothetical protein
VKLVRRASLYLLLAPALAVGGSGLLFLIVVVTQAKIRSIME